MSSELYPRVKFRNLLIGPVRNGIYKQKKFHGRGCKIINMGELFSYSRLYDVPMKRVEINENDVAKSLVQVGDLIFARRSLVASGAGKCSIIKKISESTTFESSIIRARPNPLLASSDYLYYYFSSPIGRERMGTILRQVAVSGITGSDLMDLEIDCPPLNVQREIAEALSLLDDRIALLHQANVILKSIAQAIFKSWFIDFDPVRAKLDGLIPEGMSEATAMLFPACFDEFGMWPSGWRKLPFTDTVHVSGGGTPNTTIEEYWSGSIPWFSVVDAPSTSDVFVINTKKSITQAGLDNSSTKLLPEGTTIISARGTVGRLALVGREMTMNQSCYALRGKSNDSYFTYFSTYRLVETLKQRSHGSVFDTITTETLKGVYVIYPPVAVINAFERTIEAWMAKIKNNLLHAQTLVSLRDTLLPRLISGQLRLPEAETILNKIAA